MFTQPTVSPFKFVSIISPLLFVYYKVQTVLYDCSYTFLFSLDTYHMKTYLLTTDKKYVPSSEYTYGQYLPFIFHTPSSLGYHLLLQCK
jgi:hypothetical protein